MAKNSKIEWTDHTVNLWWGCSKVHTGCKNCYAERQSSRYGFNVWGENSPRKLIMSAFKDLDKYQRQAKDSGKMVKVFVGSMMDIFEYDKNLINPDDKSYTIRHLRNKLFHKISQKHYTNLIFLFLTKRIGEIHPYYITIAKLNDNIWFGFSISNQETSDKYIKDLMEYKKVNTFLSIEPQVGLIDDIDLTNIDWVIQGGESGPYKRPFKIEWAETMRDICKDQNTPYFFKQIDKIQSIPEHLNIKEYPNFE